MLDRVCSLEDPARMYDPLNNRLICIGWHRRERRIREVSRLFVWDTGARVHA
jgi:hypothetical protein